MNESIKYLVHFRSRRNIKSLEKVCKKLISCRDQESSEIPGADNAQNNDDHQPGPDHSHSRNISGDNNI